MTLRASLDVRATADRVVFRFAVENAGTDPVTLRYRSGQTAAVTVTDDAGETAWDSADDRMFTQALREETLGPGEEATAEVAWDDPAPGDYEATAALAATPTAETTARFSV